MSEKIRTITEDPEHYKKSFRLMKQQLSLLGRWTDEMFQQLPENLNIRGRNLKFLGVGSGSGEVEFSNTLQLLKTYSTISHTVVEPGIDHVREYKQLVTKEADKVKSVKYHWRQQTLDQYRNEVGTSNKYDIIVSMNSAYYFDNVEDSLMYLYDILEDGGILLVIVVSENGLSYKIWNRFPKFYQDFPFHQICSNHLINTLKKQNIGYEVKRLRSDVDLNECFIEASEDGKYFVDFLSHVINLRESVSVEWYTEFISFLKDSSRLDQERNKWISSTEHEAIFIKK